MTIAPLAGVLLIAALTVAARLTPEAAAEPPAATSGWSLDGPSAPPPRAAGPQNRLTWQILENPNGPHTALILDPVRQVFAVYHVDPGSGEIKLKSVRNLSHDLRLPHHNSNSPTPKDIQLMLEDSRRSGS